MSLLSRQSEVVIYRSKLNDTQPLVLTASVIRLKSCEHALGLRFVRAEGLITTRIKNLV